MSPRDDPEQVRFEFRIGDVFKPEDKVARYLVRLSTALGDLRIAGIYLARAEQPQHESIYFSRLTAAHLHELTILFDPSNQAVPSVDDFITAVVPSEDAETADKLRASHAAIRDKLAAVLDLPDEPPLRKELRRLRNGFFHYFNQPGYEPALTDAMRRAGPEESAYVIREHTMRAEYADVIAAWLVGNWDLAPDPWQAKMRTLQTAIAGLIDPVTDFLHIAEAVYLGSRPAGVVRRKDLE